VLPKTQDASRLKFFRGNAKLGRDVWTFSLPAGHTCPGAKDCLAKVTTNAEGKRSLQDGKDAKFRCFAASQEVAFPTVYAARQHNFNTLRKLRTAAEIVQVLEESLPVKMDVLRVHVSGDFFSRNYFDAWMQVAAMRPETIFYAYTKSLHFYTDWVRENGDIPENFKITASEGGKFDTLIEEHSLVFSRVVFYPSDAKKQRLKIDHDDTLAMASKTPFALLIHGPGAAGSPHSKALTRMRKEGIKFSYARK
jgi:hypothetical protein